MKKTLAWVTLTLTLLSLLVVFPYYLLSTTDFKRLMVILGVSIAVSFILVLCLKIIMED